MFLGLLFDVVIFVLFSLSITLIYSLILLNVETKKFEFGILRSLGLSKFGLVQLILTQACFFILPAIFLGLLLSCYFLN